MSFSPINASITLCISGFLSSLNAASLELLIFRIGQVESGCRADAVGDGGKALGFLQIHEGVVKDVNSWETSEGYCFRHSDAFNPMEARKIFKLYMGIYATPKRLGRPVTDIDRALIWHSGPNGWKKPKSKRNVAYLAKFRPPLQ